MLLTPDLQHPWYPSPALPIYTALLVPLSADLQCPPGILLRICLGLSLGNPFLSISRSAGDTLSCFTLPPPPPSPRTYLRQWGAVVAAALVLPRRAAELRHGEADPGGGLVPGGGAREHKG